MQYGSKVKVVLCSPVSTAGMIYQLSSYLLKLALQRTASSPYLEREPYTDDIGLVLAYDKTRTSLRECDAKFICS